MEKSDSNSFSDKKEDALKKSINPNAVRQFSNRRKRTLSMPEWVAGIRARNRVILSQAITLIESESPRHQATARELVEACLPFANASLRIGITGSPGVGKSTFIEALGAHLIEKGNQLAVLAIDPSSQLSKGSILGDKTRMEQLTQNEAAFIRPSPAGSSLGGVARKTRETIVLCEAAGFDIILVETVGVGQSEMAVHSMVDCFLLLLLPGAGDELQGIKRGIVEMADLVVVNKADGDRLALARQARLEYRNALHLFPPKTSGWTPQVKTCSALQQEGIDQIWSLLLEFQQTLQENGFFAQHRQEQARFWFRESIKDLLQHLFYQNETIQKQLPILEAEVLQGKRSPFHAAEQLLALFRSF